MKNKSKINLTIIIISAIILVYLSLFGIGEQKIFSVHNINQGLDLRGGVSITYEAIAENPTQEEMNSTVSLLRGRLDRQGHTEAVVTQQGYNRIRVEIPGAENTQEVIDELGQTAQLVFMSEDGEILLTGDQVANASRQAHTNNMGVSEVVVALEFTEEGRVNFANATRDNVGRRIIIMLDNEVLSAPIVNEPITGGQAIINGGFTIYEAVNLAELIRAGSLPFDLEVVQRNQVGATLGANSLSTSVKAGVVGFTLVIIFMLVQYKVLGIAASIALIIFLALQLILLNILGVTLTLPGIAGIVLSIGMAVDGNIIIFERIREEIITGRTVKSSVNLGFKRAFPAILDGNITTLIASIVLFLIGSGPIRGFAQTLTIGIVVSMFTTLLITKVILKSFVGIGVLSPKTYGIKIGVDKNENS
jgi:preprotein translocase subunit SecD